MMSDEELSQFKEILENSMQLSKKIIAMATKEKAGTSYLALKIAARTIEKILIAEKAMPENINQLFEEFMESLE